MSNEVGAQSLYQQLVVTFNHFVAPKRKGVANENSIASRPMAGLTPAASEIPGAGRG
jgi:hypothetical protein